MTEDSLSVHDNHPNANSTMIDSFGRGMRNNASQRDYSDSLNEPHEAGQSINISSHNVGHMSHIPRTPPSPATYTIPTINNQSTIVDKQGEDIFGMIKLGDNDVCYTSGTIEWVGRKRSFPINTGFKTLNSKNIEMTEPFTKKIRQNKTFTRTQSKLKECDCADVLPTVNAIVDHLNALHEAVDLVDLRLNTLEDVISRDV